jgi:hypothetical protein
MQEDNINFEEIGKDETAHAEQSSAVFKQPIRGHYDSLHEELKARCAPENFMNPYEPEKVSRANKLYSEILSIGKNDNEKLKLLRLRAMEELGIKFSTEQLFEKLTAACNPKNFTGDSYNEERLELANGLYQQILMNADDIFALEEIEDKAGDLIKDYKSETQTQPKDDSNKEEWLLSIWFSIIFIIIILYLIFLRT